MITIKGDESPPVKRLLHDEAGLSTMEYTVLFVVIVVGALGLWSALGQDARHVTAEGSNKMSDALGEITGVKNHIETSPGQWKDVSPPDHGDGPRKKRKITQ